MEKDKLQLALEKLDEVSGGEAFSLDDNNLRTAYEILTDLSDEENSWPHSIEYAEKHCNIRLFVMYCTRFLNVLTTLDMQFNLRSKLARVLTEILDRRWKEYSGLIEKEFENYYSNLPLS